LAHLANIDAVGAAECNGRYRRVFYFNRCCDAAGRRPLACGCFFSFTSLLVGDADLTMVIVCSFSYDATVLKSIMVPVLQK
jgi:hypothetical protein